MDLGPSQSFVGQQESMAIPWFLDWTVVFNVTDSSWDLTFSYSCWQERPAPQFSPCLIKDYSGASSHLFGQCKFFFLTETTFTLVGGHHVNNFSDFHIEFLF